MNTLSNAPFIRILPAFCIGICISFFHLLNYECALAILIVGFSGIITFSSVKKKNYSIRCLNGIFLQLIYLVLGFALTEIKDERKSNLYFDKSSECNTFFAEIVDCPKGNGKYLRSTVNIISSYKDNSVAPAKGKMYLYFRNDSSLSYLLPGDKLIFSGSIAAIPPPLNPGQFDFKYRSSIHRIYYQAYLNKDKWEKLPASEDFSLKRLSYRLRNKFLSTYKDAGITGQEYAVLSALVLGYDDEIDRETMKAFSASGTLHVLSVSGMHVGIIFTALSAMLTFLERKKSTRIIRIIILLASLWFYAMLTGLSPSVIRSAMMFSFILLGRSLNRSSNIYNSLALSALCIFIFFDPLMLFEVGLQLSYLAVAGIAFIYPMVYRWIYIENKLIDKIWALIAVSIAAQTATFALSIYYFHQFPNYFIPANLIIIPISTVGIFAGIILLFISPFNFISVKAGWIINKIIYLLNASAVFIEDLPGSVWQGIVINVFDMVMIYSIMFAIIYFLLKRSISYLYSLQVFIVLLIASFIYTNSKISNREEVVFYSNTSSLCCQFSCGDYSFLLYHSADSVQALRLSDAYCLSQGLDIDKRKIFSLDNKGTPPLPFFISGNKILYRNFQISDFSDSTNSFNFKTTKMHDSNILYLKNADVKYISEMNILASEVIVNGKTIPGNRKGEHKLPLIFLADGARIIKL